MMFSYGLLPLDTLVLVDQQKLTDPKPDMLISTPKYVQNFEETRIFCAQYRNIKLPIYIYIYIYIMDSQVTLDIWWPTSSFKNVNHWSICTVLKGCIGPTTILGKKEWCTNISMYLPNNSTMNSNSQVGWDYRRHRLSRGRPLPTRALDMTLNNQMVRECQVHIHCHRSQVHSDQEW